MEINLKLCTLCGEIKRFNMRTNKKGERVTTGKKCISCCSSLNNIKLRSKQYYKTYYVENAEVYKQRDRERYLRKKESQNLVSFSLTPNNTDIEV